MPGKKPSTQGTYTNPDQPIQKPQVPIAPGRSGIWGPNQKNPARVGADNPPNQMAPNALTIQPDTEVPPKKTPTKKPALEEEQKRGTKKPPVKEGGMDNLKPLDAAPKKPFPGAAPPFKPKKKAGEGAEGDNPNRSMNQGLDHNGHLDQLSRGKKKQ